MVTKFNSFKNGSAAAKKALQTFHRIEGPGKTLLNLLELFPFSAKKFKLIKFNSSIELHNFLVMEYRRSFINYKSIIKKVKKKLLLKVKTLRFRILNKYLKLLTFLINFLNDSFNDLIYEFFYSYFNTTIEIGASNPQSNFLVINKKKRIKKDEQAGSKRKTLFLHLKDKIDLNKNLDFYVLMNNGLLELIGHFNDSVLLKLKQKIFLYYYNFFGMNSVLPKLSTKLRYLKNGDTFFFPRNIVLIVDFIKFLDFFKLLLKK